MNWLHMCSQFDGESMRNRDEMIKQEKYKLIVGLEQQLYDDVRLILKRAREQAYDRANGIMIQVYWNVGRRIVGRNNMVKESEIWFLSDKKSIEIIIRRIWDRIFSGKFKKLQPILSGIFGGVIWICKSWKNSMVSSKKYNAYF